MDTRKYRVPSGAMDRLSIAAALAWAASPSTRSWPPMSVVTSPPALMLRMPPLQAARAAQMISAVAAGSHSGRRKGVVAGGGMELRSMRR
jgi:hypothetical protein